jgi:hypothetical protein
MECPDCQQEILRPTEGFDPEARIFMCPFCVEPINNPDFQPAMIPPTQVGKESDRGPVVDLDGLAGRTIAAVERRTMSLDNGHQIDVLTLHFTDGVVAHIVPDSPAVTGLIDVDARYQVQQSAPSPRGLLRPGSRALAERDLTALRSLEALLRDGLPITLIAAADSALSGSWIGSPEHWPRRNAPSDTANNDDDLNDDDLNDGIPSEKTPSEDAPEDTSAADSA